MPFYLWSQTAASNATADPTINWAEGQAPSSVNDSARAMMAAAAKYRDDNSGSLATAGTSSAYTLATNQVFDNVTHMDGQSVSFTAHASNAATATLNVDGLGAALFSANGGNTIPAGTILAGSTYAATYKASFGNWILKESYGNPFNIPVGAGMDYWGATVPSSNFAFADGAAISRTTNSVLFSIIGTTYGAGDGSTTFNLPNKTERVSVMKAAVASLLTATYFGGDSTVLGAVGGGESKTLLTANLPPYTPTGTVSGASSGSDTILVNGNAAQNLQGGTTGFGWSNSPTLKAISAALSWAGSFVGVAQGGTSTPIRTVQPTIVCNYIIRII